MLLDHAVEGRLDDDHHEADETHLRPVHGQGNDEDDCRSALDEQAGHLGGGPALRFLGIIILEDFPHRRGKLRAIAKGSCELEGQAGHEPHHEDGHGHRRHAHEELHKLPAGLPRDEQVLGLAHGGANAPKGRANGRMHHEGAKEAAEVIEIFSVHFPHFVI